MQVLREQTREPEINLKTYFGLSTSTDLLGSFSIHFRAIRRNVHTNFNPNSKNESH